MPRSAELCPGSVGVTMFLHLCACQSIIGLDDLAFADAGSSARSYRDEVLLDHPIGYWRFDESAPTKAANEVAMGAEGTFEGTVELLQPGALRDAQSTGAHFDGEQVNPDRVDFGNLFGFEGTAAFAIEIWIAPETPVEPD